MKSKSEITKKYKVNTNFSWDIANTFIYQLPKYLIPVGSFKRKELFHSDLDLLSMIDLDKVVEAIVAKGIKICDSLYSGKQRKTLILEFMVRTMSREQKVRVFVDLIKTTKEELPYALFHWTGNKKFNIRTRALAKKMGYKLNQYGLFDKMNKLIKFSSEKEIFSFLGVTYKTPNQRIE